MRAALACVGTIRHRSRVKSCQELRFIFDIMLEFKQELRKYIEIVRDPSGHLVRLGYVVLFPYIAHRKPKISIGILWPCITYLRVTI